jgi:hypothetical protein
MEKGADDFSLLPRTPELEMRTQQQQQHNNQTHDPSAFRFIFSTNGFAISVGFVCLFVCFKLFPPATRFGIEINYSKFFFSFDATTRAKIKIRKKIK